MVFSVARLQAQWREGAMMAYWRSAISGLAVLRTWW